MSWWVWLLVIVVAVWALGVQGGLLGILARLNAMEPIGSTSRALLPPSARALKLAAEEDAAP